MVGIVVPLREIGRFRLRDQSNKVKKAFRGFLKSTCILSIPWAYVCNDENKAYSGLSHVVSWGLFGQWRKKSIASERGKPHNYAMAGFWFVPDVDEPNTFLMKTMN